MGKAEKQPLLIHLGYIDHMQLKARAAQEGRSMASIVREVIGKYLEDNPPEFPLTEWRELYDAREKERKEAEARAKKQGLEIGARIQGEKIKRRLE